MYTCILFKKALVHEKLTQVTKDYLFEVTKTNDKLDTFQHQLSAPLNKRLPRENAPIRQSSEMGTY